VGSWQNTIVDWIPRNGQRSGDDIMQRLPTEPDALGKVFVSYTHEDRARAKVLADGLSARGWSVWWDRTIPPGRTFDEVIEEALDDAQCVVVLWSTTSVASNWVRAEAAEGARRQILVPALLDKVKIPLEFRRLQAADLTNWNGDQGDAEFEQFVRSISRLARSRVPPSPPPHYPPLSPQSSFDSFEQATVPGRALEPRAKHRFRWALGILLLGALAAPIGWRYFILHNVPVPDVVGNSLTDAKSAVSASGLAIGQIEDRPTDDVPPNRVLDQRPAASTTVTAGKTVDLVVSSAVRVSVPSLTGVQLEEGHALLRSAGLMLGNTTFRETTDVGVSGSIVAQRPVAGELASKGNAVDVVIARSPSVGSLKSQSDGSSEAKKTRLSDTAAGRGRPADATRAIEVPAVTGLLLSEARDRLARRGFIIGRIERQATSTWAPDTVVTQEPVAGSRVSGTSISLVVAEQADLAVPALVGLPPDKALVLLASLGLEAGNFARTLDEKLKEDSVIGQTPLSGSRIAKGGRVDLDIGRAATRVPRLVGLSLQDASSLLTRARLERGVVTRRQTTGSTVGTTLSQSIRPGNLAAIGTRIDLEIASAAADNGTTNPTGTLRAANTATGFRAVDRSPMELEVEVDLFYDGSFGTSYVSVQACAVAADGKGRPRGTQCGRAPLPVGPNHFTLTMRTMTPSNPAAVQPIETSFVEICITQGQGRAPSIGGKCQLFPYPKVWRP
jgi:beta-lactam-binding protein with PASTA domain